MTSVKIKYEENKEEILTNWTGCGIPINGKFELKENKEKGNLGETLVGFDEKSKLKFHGTVPSSTSWSNYYIGIRKGKKMTIRPVKIFNMMPVSELIEEKEEPATPMTLREQREEITDKFGSKKVQRQLAKKRQFAVHYTGEDVDDIEDVDHSFQVLSEAGGDGKTEIDILPTQNKNAISVNEVYDINDVISENEREMILKSITQLKDELKFDLTKKLRTKSHHGEKDLLAVYLDYLIQFIQLKYQDLRKRDPLQNFSEAGIELKACLYEKFLTKQKMGNNWKFQMPDKQRDRLLIYAIIVAMTLNNFNGVSLEEFEKVCRVPKSKLKKVSEIVGCYVEAIPSTTKGSNKQQIILKLPLNTYSEGVKRKKRRI